MISEYVIDDYLIKLDINKDYINMDYIIDNNKFSNKFNGIDIKLPFNLKNIYKIICDKLEKKDIIITKDNNMVKINFNYNKEYGYNFDIILEEDSELKLNRLIQDKSDLIITLKEENIKLQDQFKEFKKNIINNINETREEFIKEIDEFIKGYSKLLDENIKLQNDLEKQNILVNNIKLNNIPISIIHKNTYSIRRTEINLNIQNIELSLSYNNAKPNIIYILDIDNIEIFKSLYNLEKIEIHDYYILDISTNFTLNKILKNLNNLNNLSNDNLKELIINYSNSYSLRSNTLKQCFDININNFPNLQIINIKTLAKSNIIQQIKNELYKLLIKKTKIKNIIINNINQTYEEFIKEWGYLNCFNYFEKRKDAESINSYPKNCLVNK